MQNTIYVSNISEATDLGYIEDLLGTVGDVMGHSIELIPESGKASTFGIFQMSTEQQATDCAERFNGYNLNGKRLAIVVERPKPRPVLVKAPKKRTGGRYVV